MNVDAIPDRLLAPEVLGQIVVVPAFFFTIIATVATVLWFGARRDRARHDLVQQFLEKGQPVPSELLAAKTSRVSSDLRRGVLLLAGGLGLGGALIAAHDRDSAGFALIPTLIGLGYLVVWWLENKRRVT